MAAQIATGAVHHLRLTVSNMDRAREFYTSVLGFQVAMEIPPIVLLSNGTGLLALGPAPDPSRATSGDRFDENRVGLDHLAFSVASRDELERAVRVLDERGVAHGQITDFKPIYGLEFYSLFFRDPDNIQLELIAPHS